MIHMGGYHEYIGGIRLHWGDIMSTSLWDMTDLCGGISRVYCIF